MGAADPFPVGVRRARAGCAALLALAAAGCGIPATLLDHISSGEDGRWTRELALSVAGLALPGRVLPEPPSDPGYHGIPGVSLPRGSRPDSCGPEVLAAVMNYWKDPVTVRDLEGATLRFDALGMDTRQFLAAAHRRGFVGRRERGSVGRIKEAVDAGTPSIVTIKRGALGHAWLAVGYNDRTQEVAVTEPGGRVRLVSFADMDREWELTRRFFLVVVPATAEELCALGEEARRQRAWRDAEAYFQRAAGREPLYAPAQTALGDLYRLWGRLEEAETAYRSAVWLDPSSVPAANNLADLMLLRGAPREEAGVLAARGVELAEAEWERLWRNYETASDPVVRSDLARRLHGAMTAHLYALGTRGQAYRALGNTAGALETWRRALRLAPESLHEYRARRLVEIAEVLGPESRDEARAHLREALSMTADAAMKEKISKALRDIEAAEATGQASFGAGRP